MERWGGDNSTGENTIKICIYQNFVVSLHLISFRDCLLVVIDRTSSAGKRGRFFLCVFLFLCCKNDKKSKKNKKIKKNSKKFAYIKKMLYLCTEFEKQPNK